MNLIEKVKKISDLDEERKVGQWHEKMNAGTRYHSAISDAAPAMLAVLGAFRPGDARVLAETLSFLISESEESDWQDAIDCLTRLQKAARSMEATK